MRWISLTAAVVLALALWLAVGKPWSARTEDSTATSEADQAADLPPAAVSQAFASEREPLVAEPVGVPGASLTVSTRIKVLTATEAPVADAEVLLLSAAAVSKALGKTGPDGSLTLEFSTGLPTGQLRVQAAGFIPQERDLETLPPSEIVFYLEKAGCLRGMVVRSDAVPVGSGIRVVAWRGHWPLPEALASWVAQPEQRPHNLVETDAAGAFVIDGLAPAATYSIAAGGQGLVSLKPSEGVADGSPVTIEVRPLYGVAVHLREPGGGLPRCNPTLDAFPGYGVSVRIGDAEAISTRSPGPILNGLPLIWLQTSVWDYAVLYAAAREVPRVGPIATGALLPGYQRATFTLFAERVLDGIPEQTIELIPETIAWGAIRVRLQGVLVPEELRRDHETGKRAIGRVELPDNRIAYSFALWAWREEPETMDRIPAGNYQFRFEEAFDQAWDWPAHDEPAVEVEIRPDRIAEVEIPVGPLSALEFRLLAADGTPWAAPVGFSLYQLRGKRQVLLSGGAFQGPPYRSGALRPGQYRLQLLSPQRLDAEEQLGGPIVLEPGLLKKLDLHLR